MLQKYINNKTFIRNFENTIQGLELKVYRSFGIKNLPCYKKRTNNTNKCAIVDQKETKILLKTKLNFHLYAINSIYRNEQQKETKLLCSVIVRKHESLWVDARGVPSLGPHTVIRAQVLGAVHRRRKQRNLLDFRSAEVDGSGGWNRVHGILGALRRGGHLQ